jgi:hypothetical protein
MPIYFKNTTDSDANANKPLTGMPWSYVGEFTLRAGNQYLDIRTNMGNNTMGSAWYWGYLYNRGNCFGFWGGYPYENTLILNNYASNMVSTTSNAAGLTILTSVYRATAANSYGTCFKFDSKSTGYSEGKINLFLNAHFGQTIFSVTAFAENNISGNYY